MSNSSDPTMKDGEYRAGAVPTASKTTRALSPEDLITLNEEIAAMARAGLPLDQGLSALASEMGRGKLRNVTQQLADDMRAGFSLPDALKRQEGRVPPYYAALLAAGIRSGKLGDVLGTLTVYARSIAEFRDIVVSAVIYPIVIAIIGFLMIVGVGVFVLPGYVTLFNDLKIELPLVTRILLFIGERPLTFVITPAVSILLAIAAERWWLRRTPRGRAVWARFVYMLPIVGTLIRSSRLSAFTELLGILVNQAVPLPEALRLAAAASSDPLLNDGALQIERDLRQGMPLGESLQRQQLVPKLVVWIIAFGERQGTLGPALLQLAQTYRRQTELRASLLRTVLPPLLILVLALTFAAVFIFGLLAPLYELMTKFGLKL
jgi:general secretion pathway protein F